MKAAIEKNIPDCAVELIESGGGVFEVERDGQLIFSKKALDRFPKEQEILSQLR